MPAPNGRYLSGAAAGYAFVSSLHTPRWQKSVRNPATVGSGQEGNMPDFLAGTVAPKKPPRRSPRLESRSHPDSQILDPLRLSQPMSADTPRRRFWQIRRKHRPCFESAFRPVAQDRLRSQDIGELSSDGQTEAGASGFAVA